MRCEHENLRADKYRGAPCTSDATYSGRIDDHHEMWLCARHASGWRRTVTSGDGTVVRL